MKRWLKHFLFIVLCIFASSCGADKINNKLVNNQSNLAINKECSFTSEGPLVCGTDGKEYINKAQAECFTTVSHIGHCQCSTAVMVCGSDGIDHNECEAMANSNYTIIKLVPCATQIID